MYTPVYLIQEDITAHYVKLARLLYITGCITLYVRSYFGSGFIYRFIIGIHVGAFALVLNTTTKNCHGGNSSKEALFHITVLTGLLF